MIRRRLIGLATRQIQAISSETIKPSNPTPSHLKRYNLSVMDQINPRIYMPVILFYPNYECDSQQNIAQKSFQLKRSLSETLTQYYPFAGRLISENCVHCNDNGVEYEEAQLECTMSEVVDEPDDVALKLLLRDGLAWSYLNYDSSLAVVRANFFACGGMAIVVCFSHKVADGCTICNFLIYWAAVSRQSGELVSPHFISSPPNNSVTLPEYLHEKKQHWVTRRFVFNNSKIASLKTLVAETGVQNPTRVDVITALLYKCAIAAARETLGFFEPAYLTQLVNMRPKLVPPLPETSVGNLFWRITVPTWDETEANVNILSDRIKKAKKQIKGLKSLDEIEELSEPQEFVNHRKYLCTSMCGFPINKVDFGWGKPVRLSFGGTSLNNMFLLMDTPSGDGIEALVSLTNQEMIALEADKELLEFASSA
ncbi:hypothetical protein LguiA_022142 [Lonicera macranthoides]